MWQQRRNLILVLALVVVLILMLGYSLVAEGSYRPASQNLWFNLGLFLTGGCLLLYALSYNRFAVQLTAILFPLFLLVCIGLNLWWYSRPLPNNWWGLQRLPSNSLAALVHVSGEDDKFMVYVYFHDYYKDRTLVAAPGLLEDAGLVSWSLQKWGRLAKVETRSYQSKLSQQQAQELLRLRHIELEPDSRKKYVFVTEPFESATSIYLAKHGDNIFILPYDLLPDQKD
ncbi:MAG: hypothetical protein GY797_41405 [Deltaproteobacteria bacterium]|nr:hypothetical protein [Deltaproteobacteria bacterium]